MRGKARFWVGMLLCGAGIATSVLAHGRAAYHVLGTALVFTGVAIAARNVHA